MKKFLAFFVAALTIPSTVRLLLARTGNSNQNSDKNLIAANLRAWVRAAMKGDASTMAGFMTDDYVQIEMETESGSGKKYQQDRMG